MSSIEIGEFTITKIEGDIIMDYWISREGGEGMGVKTEALVNLLEEFWKREF